MSEKIQYGHTSSECRADGNHRCTLCGLPVTAAGFIVVLNGEHDGKLSIDWDGEIHTTREAGDAALADARKAGYDAFLVAGVPVAGASQ
jgi:hypothetical protein